MRDSYLGILLSGSSHVGKTTLAQRLAEDIGCEPTSTDSLARHPGRPWPDVREPVAEYYSRLSLETVYWFLKVHHENMWPMLLQRIKVAISARKSFIFEGSALRPEYIAPLVSNEVSAVLLHIDNDHLQGRMRSEAKYSQLDEARRTIADKFIDQSLRDNTEMNAAARRHALRIVDSFDSLALDGLFDELRQWTSR